MPDTLFTTSTVVRTYYYHSNFSSWDVFQSAGGPVCRDVCRRAAGVRRHMRSYVICRKDMSNRAPKGSESRQLLKLDLTQAACVDHGDPIGQMCVNSCTMRRQWRAVHRS